MIKMTETISHFILLRSFLFCLAFTEDKLLKTDSSAEWKLNLNKCYNKNDK